MIKAMAIFYSICVFMCKVFMEVKMDSYELSIPSYPADTHTHTQIHLLKFLQLYGNIFGKAAAAVVVAEQMNLAVRH